MKAVAKFGFGDKEVEIREVPEPKMGPGQVMVEVKATGVCGSDVHMWRNMQSWEITLPLVLGPRIRRRNRRCRRRRIRMGSRRQGGRRDRRRSLRRLCLLPQRRLQPLSQPPRLRRPCRRLHDQLRRCPSPRSSIAYRTTYPTSTPRSPNRSASPTTPSSKRPPMKPGDLVVIQGPRPHRHHGPPDRPHPRRRHARRPRHRRRRQTHGKWPPS